MNYRGQSNMTNLYKNKIPIKNVYYMLSYAYDFLEYEELNHLGEEQFDNIYEMLSIILLQGIYSQIKKGLYKEYIDINEDLPYIKGKLNMNNTLFCICNSSINVNCDYEKYSINNIFNQIIKTTLILLQNKDIDLTIKQKISKCLEYFYEVDVVNFDNNFSWKSIIYNRNNKMYKMLIDICYLINDSLIISENSGDNSICAYFDEKKIAKLYERFIYEFYKKELPDVNVSFQKKFNYKDASGDIINLIPAMYTDIVITKENKTLIIDTKFYQETLNRNEFYKNSKIHSAHMAQMYSYMNNIPLGGEISGMLLYPTVDFELHKNGLIQDNKIFINTINLNEDFEHIKTNLINIVVNAIT